MSMGQRRSSLLPCYSALLVQMELYDNQKSVNIVFCLQTQRGWEAFKHFFKAIFFLPP